jgi:hypothetical protein
MPKTRIIKWPHVTAMYMLKYGLWGTQVITHCYGVMAAMMCETNDSARRCCWSHFAVSCVWLALSLANELHNVKFEAFLLTWALGFCRQLPCKENYWLCECFIKGSHVTPVDMSMGNLMICYVRFRIINFPFFLPYSFPNLHVIERYFEADI